MCEAHGHCVSMNSPPITCPPPLCPHWSRLHAQSNRGCWSAPSEQLGGEATSDGLSIAHGEPHLQQLIDDGGLVSGVDAVAMAQAQDGHLQDAMKLPQAVHRVLMPEAQPALPQDQIKSSMYITCHRTMSCRSQSRLGSRRTQWSVCQPGCHLAVGVQAPHPLGSLVRRILPCSICDIDSTTDWCRCVFDNHAACCANVEVGALPEDSRRSISCLSNGTPLASRAIQTLYSGTDVDHHWPGKRRMRQLLMPLQCMHEHPHLCKWALPAGRHRRQRRSQHFVSHCDDISSMSRNALRNAAACS